MAYTLGATIAHVPVPALLREHAVMRAHEFFRTQELQNFNEQVDTQPIPPKFKHLRHWAPATPILQGLGYRYQSGRSCQQHWVLTAGVETHSDNAFGPTLVWTIHNDGLEFWQRGGARRTPAAGDIMIFDDRIDHSMDLTRAQMKDSQFDRAVWIGWAIALRY
jgi:hypothetical protein